MPRYLCVLFFLPLSLPALPLRFEFHQGHYTARGVTLTATGPVFASGVRMTLPGAPRPTLEQGDLLVGAQRHHRPLAWQQTPTGRHYIDANYRLRGAEVTFDLAGYDPHLPLVIDPVLAYATFAGGSGAETGSAI